MAQQPLQVAALLGIPTEDPAERRVAALPRGGQGARREAQLTIRREDGGPLEDVVQLADVAGPGVTLELLPHGGGQVDGGAAILPGEALEEALGQGPDVLGPFAQGG